MIDKTELGEVLAETVRIGQESYLYHWSGIIEDSSLVDIEKIYVRNVGTVDIPVSPEVIDSIEAKYFESSVKETSPTLTEQCPNCCRVDGSEVFIIPGNKKKLSDMLSSLASSVLARMLDIEVQHLALNVKVNLEQLVICKSGQSFSRSVTNKKEPGMFGTMLMQIPIKSDQPSGQLLIRDRWSHETEVDLQATTQNKDLFLAAMAGTNQDDRSQGITIHPAQSNGMVFMLIFNLVWRDCLSLLQKWTSEFFPKYLIMANKLSKGFSLWNEKVPGQDSLQLSKLRSQEITNAFNDKQANFLCIPLTKSYGNDPSTWNLTGQDLLVSTIFDMINFVDVNFAIIKRKLPHQPAGIQESTIKRPPMEKSSLFIFEKGFFTPNSIRDGLFNSLISLKKHLIPTGKSLEEGSNTLQVLVIRPRKLSFRIIKKPSLDELQPENLLLDIEERLNGYNHDCISSQSSSGSLLRDLELLLDMLQDFEADFIQESYKESGQPFDEAQPRSSHVKCIKCLLYRLLIVCVELKNTNHGLRVLLHISNLKDQSIFFRCHKCGVDLSNPNPVSVIAKFVCVVAGWESSYIPLKIMLSRKLDKDTYADFCDLGIKLIHGDCMAGAREIFYHVFCYLENDALQRFQTEELDYGTQFFNIAMELHSKNNDDMAIQRALRLSKMMSPSSLMFLVDHLVDMKRNEKMDTALYLRRLADIIADKLHSTVFFDHLPKILKIYQEFGEVEALEQIWTRVCSHCIQMHNSENCETANLKVTCVFCHFLLRTDEDDDDLLRTMANARNAQDALSCSIDKITGLNCGSSFHYKEVLSYVRRIIGLQDYLPVYFHLERMESFCSLFSCIHVEDICDLLDSILGPKRDQITRDTSVKCQLIKLLILQLLNRKEDCLNTLSKDYIRMVIEFCFWNGESGWMKNLLKRLDSRVATQPDMIELIITTFTKILKAKVADQDVLFYRDIIHLLVWKWVKALRGYKTGKSESFLDCFQVLFRAEKAFQFYVNPGNLTLEFSRTIDRFDFLEKVEILKSIFTCEYGEDLDSCLKMLPTSLKTFSTLCNNIISRMDAEKIVLVPVDSLLVLMQCFLWLGEEKPIVDLTLLLLSLPRSPFVEDVLDAIIYEENSADLAASSSYGVIAMGDLIDRRIEQLTPLPTKNFFSRICPPLLGKKKSNTITVFYVEPESERESTAEVTGTKSLSDKMEQLAHCKAKYVKGVCDK